MADPKDHIDPSERWAEALNLLQEILAQLPMDQETKWGVPVYTVNKKNVIGLAAFKHHLALWFYNGILLRDDAGLLVNDGNDAKIVRQWRFTSIDQISTHEKQIQAYVREAIALAEAGITPPKMQKPEVKSALLDAALASDPVLAEAFKSLSASCRREFITHVEGAKREETRISRLEKIKPMILERRGLHDKYKKKKS